VKIRASADRLMYSSATDFRMLQDVCKTQQDGSMSVCTLDLHTVYQSASGAPYEALVVNSMFSSAFRNGCIISFDLLRSGILSRWSHIVVKHKCS